MNNVPQLNSSAEDQRMEKVIYNYMTMETSYALLVNGKRGIGKTFYMKDRIIPKIGSIKVYHDQRKSYKAVYISLYGIKSIDEVYTLMAIEFMPWLQNKGAKIGLSIGKLVARGLLNINKAGDVDGYLKDLSATAKTAIDTKDFVIIFDDLDRISISLDVTEIVGFINSLVEHENNKIIVIADEEKLTEKDKYIAVREKTIGTIIEYTATFSDNYDAIISSKYKETYQSYYDYLVILKQSIIDCFEMTDTNNLRTLIYFLQHFHEVFSRVHLALQLQNHDSESVSFKKVKSIVLFAIAITIEFKKGELNYLKKRGIDDMRAIGQILQSVHLKEMFADHQRSLQSPPAPPQVKSYKENFLDTYYKDETYNFYPSLYNFITGGDAFEADELLQQLKNSFDDKIYQPTPQELVYQQVSDPEVLNLTNDKYACLTDEMLKYAIDGAYPLDRYLSILFYLERYPEIKPYDIAKETGKLIEGVKANRQNFQYDSVLTEKFEIEQSRENYVHFLNLFRALNEVNSGIETARVENIRADILKEFMYTPDEFYHKISQYYDYDYPVLAHWNFPEFYAHFQSLPTSEIPRFTRFLKKRFGEVLIKDKLEYYFIEQLFNAVQLEEPDQALNFRLIILRNLGTLLHEIITKNYQLKK